MVLISCADNSLQSDTPAITQPPSLETEERGTAKENSELEDKTSMEEVISGAFAIQNIQTGKNIRPYNAGTSDGNDIILKELHSGSSQSAEKKFNIGSLSDRIMKLI